MNTERYDRQTILKEFGMEAQLKLQSAKVLVIGAGGLGVPVLTYLNAMGVGTLGIVDNDIVSLSNLHRQVLYSESDVNKSKVAVAVQKLKEQNSETNIISFEMFLTCENALEIIAGYDVVVDASDNFPTRYLVNDACVILNKPFVYGALHSFEGQVSVFNFKGGPTYRCLFPEMPKSDEVPNCNENGVLGIVPGIIGNFQALETVKIITGIGETLSGKLLLFDGLSSTFQKIRFAANPENLKINALQEHYDFDCGVAVTSITSDVFQQVIEEGEVQLIDVRTPKEFSRNHLSFAKNIPLSELDERHTEISYDTHVYVVCQSGVRSRKAVEKLKGLHANANLINVEGGMNQISKHALKY
ncbi:sulfurtransferase [Zobellia amurskyensis]|uniref:Molybdopterin-synthase adenylyltransferase n=1 Tax=Zobellia amurskyensis TaxID=248905 RepID=A0A7X2ZT39_9FLAO|nr:HesA/MoeB/ThiF family protein [Zobellia amurskyensis]MUH35859.1 sulfurtransferase [Zobellia amurskyensis]